ncbi:CLUMA_CG002145, isoform A [Clunio marinus]|uniref:CLUMA_CG002145, isoform A n=1 Tax=Clunio marinus TaxID=568069 RepID=A0A1J1HJY0_9DIPT|nr:CLUMA_CG002145, isoform A [Clunio marinus]
MTEIGVEQGTKKVTNFHREETKNLFHSSFLHSDDDFAKLGYERLKINLATFSFTSGYLSNFLRIVSAQPWCNP